MKRVLESRGVLFGARAAFKRTDTGKLKAVVSAADVRRTFAALHHFLRSRGVDPSDAESLASAVDRLDDAQVAHAARAVLLLAIPPDLEEKRVLASFYAGVECACLSIEPRVRAPLEEKVRRARARPKVKPSRRAVQLDAYERASRDMRARGIDSKKMLAGLLGVNRETLRRFERTHTDEIAAIGTKLGKVSALG